MHLSRRLTSRIVRHRGPAPDRPPVDSRSLRSACVPGTLALAVPSRRRHEPGHAHGEHELASAWRLPVLFVCKDDGWSITTGSEKSPPAASTSGRAAWACRPAEADGLDVERVWRRRKAWLRSGREALPCSCTFGARTSRGIPRFQLLRGVREPCGRSGNRRSALAHAPSRGARWRIAPKVCGK